MTNQDQDSNVSVRLLLERHHKQAEELAEAKADLLKFGGGGGTSGGMEARVAKLEADVEHVKKGVDRLVSGADDLKKEVSGLRERLVAVETKIDALPTKDWIGGRLQAYVAIMAGVAAIAVAATKLIA